MKRPVANRDAVLITNGSVIGFYEREFYVLSNFSSFQVMYDDVLYPTSEHAYQAAHFTKTKPELAQQIIACRSAHEACKLAKANAQHAPKNWDEIKAEVMYKICKAKLEQHPYVREKLLQTEDLYLVEDSPVDSYWGWGADRRGENLLGTIWMRLRSEQHDWLAVHAL
mgnify:CR=1 FL=1